jgi:hypothetical protein
MKKNIIFSYGLIILLYCLTFPGYSKDYKNWQINSIVEIKQHFKNPPVEFRSAPLWVWNDKLTREEIDQQLIELKAGGMGGVFIHPRPGLITSYLSDEWFEMCRYTVDKCKEMGMQVWLYDENSYPSGFAGGHVPAEMPESFNQGQGMVMHKMEKLPDSIDDKALLILKKDGSEYFEITNQLKKFPKQKGEYYLFKKSFYGKNAWHGGFSYVDLLLDGVTEKFIELTMDGYEKYIGDEFGKIVPGIFTDEPNIHPPSGLKWTPSLFEKFKERWGYDLKTNLPSLFLETGDWRRIRHNYYALLLEMFVDRWGKPWFEYCEKKNLQWTGHYWEHGWPNPLHCIDNMAMYAWHQTPAIDILMNIYSENVNAQFGNVRAVKELSSVANQMGRTRTLSETYGAGGWDLRFEDMKRIGDWEYVLGVNFLNQHLSYVTIKGARKRDHPQSFSYHAEWWKHYHVMGDYYGRLSLALSSGKQINNILVFEPTSTAWMYFSPQESHKKLSDIGSKFQKFLFNLEKYQVEYDLASENIIKNNGKVIGDKYVIGQRSYDLIVFPPTFENLDLSAFDLVKQYLKNGGKILSINSNPGFVDGQQSQKLFSLAEKYSKQWTSSSSVSDPKSLSLMNSDIIQFEKPEKIPGILFHHRRTMKDGNVVFLVNSSLDEWANGNFQIVGESAEELDLETGEIKSYPYQSTEQKVSISFDLPPAGSLLLNITNVDQLTEQSKSKAPDIKIVNPAGKMEIKRLSPNVLTLDYCDLILNGEKKENLYFFKAADQIYKKNGFNGNPWSRAVQYKTSIVDRDKFHGDSGFEAVYYFDVEIGVNKTSLRAVVERPELWHLWINDKKIKANENEYWLDRAFGVYEIGEFVNEGKNQIKLIADKMTVYSELEAIYILGLFNLESQTSGWKLIKEKPLACGKWNEQGIPFYSDGISYTQKYNVDGKDKRFIVNVPFWYGSVAEVKVNGKDAGIIGWQPDELDITELIQNGENEVSVIVYGTPKNLLGPHHNGPARGSAWPAMFENGPERQPAGNKYDVISYGLFEKFKLFESEGEPQRVYKKYLQATRPKISPTGGIFEDTKIMVTISSKTKAAEIRYTLNGEEPDQKSSLYTSPLKLNKSTTVKAIAFKNDLIKSEVEEKTFSFVNKDKNGINYKYYKGTWTEKLPDFEKLEPDGKGVVYNFDLDKIERRRANFAVEFFGHLKIEKKGEYTFYSESNDGSKLFIDDKEVVDNDGGHGLQERSGRIKLASGLHEIKVLYFDAGGTQHLKVYYEGPGIQKQGIPAFRLFKN